MGELWTDEMEQELQRELQRLQAIKAEAENPKDFLVARDINISDRLRGFACYAVLAIRYWAVGGHKPWPLLQHIACANIDRQQRANPARQKECEEWLKETATAGDPFEGLFFDDD